MEVTPTITDDEILPTVTLGGPTTSVLVGEISWPGKINLKKYNPVVTAELTLSVATEVEVAELLSPAIEDVESVVEVGVAPEIVPLESLNQRIDKPVEVARLSTPTVVTLYVVLEVLPEVGVADWLETVNDGTALIVKVWTGDKPLEAIEHL